MTVLEKIALDWLGCRKAWLELGSGNRSFAAGERDRIVEAMDAAELALAREAEKIAVAA